MIMSIGFDIGGTKINVVRVEDGKIIKSTHVSTDKSTPEAFIKQLKGLTAEFGGDLPIGIGIAGQVDNKRGLLYFAPNIGFKDLEIRKELGLPNVFLLNDVRAAGMAEWRYGEGIGVSNFITLFLGTGIGGMIVANGKILEGFQNLAGEIGHITVDFKGDKCTCGAIGCIETLASGWGIAKRVGVKTAKEALEKGASQITEEATIALALLIKSLINLNNPEKIILGGGLLKGYISIYPDFIKQLEEKVKQEALKNYQVKLVISKLSENSPALGAATFALESFKNGI